MLCSSSLLEEKSMRHLPVLEIRPERQKEGIPCIHFHFHFYWSLLGIRIPDVPHSRGCCSSHILHTVCHHHSLSRPSNLLILLHQQKSRRQVGWTLRKVLSMLP